MRSALVIGLLLVAPWVCCSAAEPKKESRPHWLPAAAPIVFTSEWADGFLPDGIYKLKAKVSAEGFAAAIKELGLTPHTPERKYTDETTWLQWAGDADPRWNLSPKLNATFVRQEKRWWQLAKYENGFLYYLSVSH